MNRKCLVWLLATFFLTFIPRANAQLPKKLPLVGFLAGPSLSSIKPRIEAFRQSLRDLNYIEGQTISFEWRSAEGIEERLPNLASELVQLKVDVIFTQATPATQAAKEATKTIPIVMSNVSDPVGSTGCDYQRNQKTQTCE